MRRIKRAKITCISLCPRGVNQMPVLFKEDGTVRMETLVKGDASLGELTSVVYVPEKVDKEGDVASAQVIKEMAYNYMRDGGQLDLRHNNKPLSKDQAYVAENFIVQKNDPRFADLRDYSGEPVDAAGAWAMVIKIDDPELRKLYKEGQWNGVSMFGTAEFGAAEFVEAKEDKSILRKIRELFSKSAPLTQEEPEMDEKLQKELDQMKSDLASVTSLVKGMVEKADAKEAEASRVAKEAKEAEEAAQTEELKKAQDDLEKAQKELTELKKASNQSTGDEGDKGELPEGLSKEDVELFKLGEAMGNAVNGEEK